MKRNPIQDIVRSKNRISMIKSKNIIEDIHDNSDQIDVKPENIEDGKLAKIKFLDSENNTINNTVAETTNQNTYSSPNPTENTYAKELVKETPIVQEEPDVTDYESVYTKEPLKTKKVRNKKLPLFIFLAVLFVGILYVLSVIFAHATVYVKNKVQHFVFTDEVFTAQRDASSNLEFEIMIVDGEESKQMIFTETKELSTKAHGEVVIYNAFSKTPQKLLINTRLEDDAKMIYMTDKAVTIPGYTMSGTKVVPGSVTVGITAANAGDKYNGDPRDFVIFGYKGTAKAKSIYARSKTSLTGGAVGPVFTPSATESGVINTDISVLLRTKLEKKLQAQIPPGYIYYPGSSQFKLDFSSDNLISKTSEATIEAKATLSAILLKSEDLQKAIIKSVYPGVLESEIPEITIADMSNLAFSYKNPAETINKTTNSISFVLNGEGDMVWNPDLEKLKTTITGMPVADLDQIFKSDPGIENARVILRPPWQKKLPKKINYITIEKE